MNSFSYSNAGLALTKHFEGFRHDAYQDQGGVWTIGYGHTGPDVTPSRRITEFEAEVLLRTDLRDAISFVNRVVRAPIVQHHFDAMVDFCYNIGRGNFGRSSLLAYVNSREFGEAAAQFSRWDLVNDKPVPGLVRRRAAETAMFQGEGAPAEIGAPATVVGAGDCS